MSHEVKRKGGHDSVRFTVSKSVGRNRYGVLIMLPYLECVSDTTQSNTIYQNVIHCLGATLQSLLPFQLLHLLIFKMLHLILVH